MDSALPDVKERILRAAKKLFAKQGFKATTTRQICEEARANVALVSYYFGGKENVFYAVIDTYFPSWKLAHYEDVFRDPVEGLKLLVREVLRMRLEDPELARILNQEIVTESPRREVLRPYIFPVWQKLREVLAEGRERGLFHFHSLDHAMLLVMGCVIFPWSTSFPEPLLADGPPDVEEVAEDTVQFVLSGLGYCPKSDLSV